MMRSTSKRSRSERRRRCKKGSFWFLTLHRHEELASSITNPHCNDHSPHRITPISVCRPINHFAYLSSSRIAPLGVGVLRCLWKDGVLRFGLLVRRNGTGACIL